MNAWLGIGLMLASFGLALWAFAWLRRRGWHSELCRKSLHVLMGCISMTLPWVFRELWPVLVLGGTVSLALIGIRFIPGLRSRFGHALGDIERRSWGELYFVVAVCVLFALSAREPLLYVIPLLVLTTADAAAALCGMFYGHSFYTASDGLKTWEGTLVFFILAFLSTWVPLTLAGTMEWDHALLSALCVAILSAMIEAGAWRGLDNLLLPLSVLAMLYIYQTRPLEQLWLRAGILGALGGGFLLLRRHVLLREGPLLGALVIVYVCWAFGGWKWTVGPIILLAAHPLFLRWNPSPGPVILHAHPALLSTGLPAVGWLLLARTTHQSELFVPFNLAIAAQLAMSWSVLWQSRRSALDQIRTLLSGLLSWLVVMGPAWWFAERTPHATTQALVGLPLVLLAAFLLRGILARGAAEPGPGFYWGWRAALSSSASILLAWF